MTLRAKVALAVKDTDDADAEISRALPPKQDFVPVLVLRLRGSTRRRAMEPSIDYCETLT